MGKNVKSNGKCNNGATATDPKLSREQQIQVCRWGAIGWGATQIVEHAEVEWSIKLNRSSLHRIYLGSKGPKKWRRLRRAIHKRFLTSVSAIPIAHKSYRLAQLQDALDEARRWRLKSVNQYATVYEQKVGVVASLVSEARKEVEGEAGGMLEAPAIIILGKLAAQTQGSPELVGSGKLNGGKRR